MQRTNSHTPICLTDGDPAFAMLIDQVGPFSLKPEKKRSPFEALVRAVAHQQLNGKAATTILGRFINLFGDAAFPSPKQVEEIEFEELRRIGFSRAKAGYVKAIAQAALTGIVPGRKEIEVLEDEAIIERLTQIKGVGRWSVEMFLMFGLGRPDVLPIHDYGVRNGFAIVYRKRKLPTPAQVQKHGERWRPHRTTAAWYLWRAVDLARETKLVMNF
ncbi:MAG: DNA-3-methyladenine glycosylase [Verrucomicrobia bacterium]|nr:DNA-3-methyladenine glycosylase [Verrucomicrobiota bacterium]